jgi:Flp pilus assembly protein TadD
MRASTGLVGIASVACLILLGGCETSVRLGDLFKKGDGDPQTTASTSADEPAASAAIASPTAGAPQATSPGLLGTDPNDDLSLGKKHYRAADFGTAERHFRRAVELHPRDAEAWIGLAASYDRLRRFELADRAYAQAIEIVGETPEILNNRGYSYMLRGDYRRARETLLAARALDPASPYIRNNLDLLDQSYRKGKAVR